MQPWNSASQRAAQQSHQNFQAASQQAARLASDAQARATAAQRDAQFAGRRSRYHDGSGRGGGSGFLRFLLTLVKLAILAGIIAVAVVLIGGE